MRLFLPEEWMSRPDHCRRAQVPESPQKLCIKPKLAIAELDQALATECGLAALSLTPVTASAWRSGLR